jgi:hypothetical protein
MFDNDLLRKEREKNSQRSRPATQEVPDDDDFSDGDEPGLKCVARETLKILSKGDGDQSDGSEKNTDSDEDASVRPENTSETWKDRHNTQLKSTKEESYLHALPRMPYGGSISFSQTGRTVSLTNTCNIDNILQIFFMLFKMMIQ